MYIYNVTIHLNANIREEWITWMQETHIPAVLATGKFSRAQMLRVRVEEEEGVTYSVQYYTDSKQMLEKYYAEDAPALRQEAIDRFADGFVAFRTELEIVHTQMADILLKK